MRKLEGIVKEIVDEMDYLKSREERFQSTNSASCPLSHASAHRPVCVSPSSIDKQTRTDLCVVRYIRSGCIGTLADLPLTGVLQAEISH